MKSVRSVKNSVTKVPKKPAGAPKSKLISPLSHGVTIPTPTKPPMFPVDPATGKRYWLVKSEPLSRIDPKTGKDAQFSILSLSQTDKEPWDGVRNYEAKNNLLNMTPGDICLFYHSNCPDPGIVGLATVAESAHPDELQFDPSSSYYDAKATREVPRWFCPDLSFLGIFHHKVRLSYLKESAEFSEMLLVKRGRLSVIPVSTEHFGKIMKYQREGKDIAQKDKLQEFDCDVTELEYAPDVVV